MNPLWSWLLALNGLCGLWMVGVIRREGWLVLILNEILWIAYALKTGQYGFIVMALSYGTIYVRSYRKWGQLAEE